MTTQNSIFIAITVAFLMVIALLYKLNKRLQMGAYRGSTLMTANELEFFGRLRAALPELHVFPQVAMSAIIEASSADRNKAYRDRLRIAQQRVDYLVCDQLCKVIAVVELDDRTHSPDKDKIRDARLLQAGIKTIRFQSRNKPNGLAIRMEIYPAGLPTLEEAGPYNNRSSH